MPKCALALVLSVAGFSAEVRTLTLREVVDLALKQSPDIVLARLDQRKTEQSVRLARDPFIPKVIVGSGLAYSNGFPMSVEGATPSIVQATAIGYVFNRPQSFRVAAAKEARRGAALDVASKQQEVISRTADLFLDADRAAKMADVSHREVDAMGAALDYVKARVAEGRELPIEEKRAQLNLARARYRGQVLEANLRSVQTSLAILLGMGPDDQVRAAPGDLPPMAVPGSADAAVKLALDSSKDIRSLEAKLLSKGYDIRADRAVRWPRIDLVAQYGLLARFNNYDEFFRKFQRNNGQIGMSFQWQVWGGPGADAAASQSEADAAQIRIQIRTLRSRIAADTRTAYDNMKETEAAQDLAKLDLDVARDQVSILLAQMQEGRAAMRQVDESRAAETDKWIAFYDAAANREKARLNLLRLAGELAAALQ